MPGLLPLFPLEVVLFPGTPLPLHVFEERYKEMIGECLAQKAPFGVVRAQGDAVAEIGCTAEIVEVTKRYPDGRLDLIAAGRSRFELVRLDDQRPFLRGEVSYFDDETSPAPPRDQIQRAVQLFTDLLALVTSEPAEVEPDQPQLSFFLAAPLPLDLDFKQTLLATRSEAKRIAAVVEYFTAILPKMKRAVKARQKAGGNGNVS